LRDILYSSIFTMFFGTVILVTVYEILPLAIQVLFNLTSVKVSLFASRFLGPTLLINLLLFVLFIFPFKRLFGTK
ncbi:rod shape-determining protein MreD, partial [Enterococcus sp. 2201sp1_2201st1_C11_2201SCRN_220225]